MGGHFYLAGNCPFRRQPQAARYFCPKRPPIRQLTQSRSIFPFSLWEPKTENGCLSPCIPCPG